MKSEPQYPWRTKVEIYRRKAENIRDKARAKAEELGDDHKDWIIHAEIELVCMQTIEKLDGIDEIFKEISELEKSYQ